MNEAIAAKIESLLMESFKEGIKVGRKAERDDIVKKLTNQPAAPAKRTRAPRKPRAPRTQPSAVEPTHPMIPGIVTGTDIPIAPTSVASIVGNALGRAPVDENGIDPDSLASFIKKEFGNGDAGISVRDVRSALRQMTMTGSARRIGRGRYIATNTPEPGTFMHS
jgi:hypothetical protein